MDLAELLQAEPRLLDLLEDGRRYPRIGRNTWSDWTRLKRRLQRLVGWGADLDVVATTEAYDVAYAALYSAWIGLEDRLVAPPLPLASMGLTCPFPNHV